MSNWSNINLSFENKEVIKSFQDKALQELIQYLQNNSAFYQKLFLDNKFDSSTIQTIADLVKLPTTSKDDLQINNWDFLCVPKSQIAEYTSTSGSLGTPVTVALSHNDIKRLAYNEYCSFSLMQLNEEDTVQLMLTLDKQFMAGMAYYQGAQKLGAAVIRTGPGMPQQQLDTILNLQTTTLVAVPSFLLKIKEVALKNGIKLNSLPVKNVLAIGESLYDSEGNPNILHQRLCADWDIKIFSTYASTEMQTAFTNCSQSTGLHANPELIIVEILDDAGLPVAEGEIGEVTITTLGVEAMPLLRYRTGDLCKFSTQTCNCGRNTTRLGSILGRKKQLIKYKGTSVYPSAIFEILNHETWIDNYLIGIHQNSELQDELRILISTHLQDSNQSISTLKETFKNKIRVVPELELSNANVLLSLQFPNGGRKPLKIIDYRP